MNPEQAQEQLTRLISGGQWEEVRSLLSPLLPADRADLIKSLDLDLQRKVLVQLDPVDAADILDLLEDYDAFKLASQLPPDVLIETLSLMRPDEAANLLGDLGESQRAQILAQLPDAEKLQSLLRYPDDSAGGLMTFEFYSFPESTQAVTILKELRSQQPQEEEVPYIYAVDEDGKLTGVARLADMIRAHPDQPLNQIAKAQIVSIHARQDQEMAARLLNRYDLMALPVVDRQQRLIGVITADDAMAVLEEETSEDIYKSAGILPDRIRQFTKSDLLVRGPVWRVWALRVPFLIITMIGGMLAGVVIEHFQETLETAVILAVFIPIIMDMGGNAGVQSTSIFIRGFVLGHIDARRIGKHLLRETAIGLGIGLILGAVTGAFAVIWHGIPALGWVVGLSLVCTVTLATLLGFLFPFILIKLGVDPTAGASPLITTVKDITGLFIYFGFASLLLGG